MGTIEEQKPADQKRWTVMLYMAASKDEQTERAAIRDLAELEKVGTTDQMNVLVQIDRQWPGYAQRYCVMDHYSEICTPLKERVKNIPLKERVKDFDSGKPDVLREFVRWGRTKYPADYYLLVLWGHAYGLGFGRDHGDPLTLPEIAQALDRGSLGIPIPDGRKAVDILGANACAMSYAEAAYELQDAAGFLVAPETTMPFAGWPYENILREIIETPSNEPKKLGERIVELFMTSFEETFEPQSVSLTLLDLGKASKIKPHLTKLTDALQHVIDRTGVRELIADAFLDTSHGDVRPLIDLFDLCERLKQINNLDDVKTAADELLTFLKPGSDLIVEHRAAANLDGINGLGIFAPSVTGAAELTRLELSEEHYSKLSLVKDQGWAKLVYKDLKALLEPMNKAVAEFVNGTGATDREDRMGVAQLLVSVHRSFIKLEKTLTDTQQEVVDTLNGNGARQPSARSKESKPVPSTFGPPYLRLTRDVGQPSYAKGVQHVAGAAFGTDVMDRAKNDRLLETVRPLSTLEDALANVEKTARRVMTNGRFGLGEDPISPKSGMGEDPISPKSGMGEDPISPKSGMGEDPISPKSGMGILPWLVAAGGGSAASQNGSTSVTELYGQVAWAMQLLEAGVAKIEDDVRTVITGATNGPTDQEYQRRTTEQMNQAFRALHEMVTTAKLTTGSVIAHPAYGLGPGLHGGFGSAGRQQLATAAGLSPRNLRLL